MNFETSRSFVNDGIDGRRGEGGESFLHFINRLYTEGGGRPFNKISSRIVSLKMKWFLQLSLGLTHAARLFRGEKKRNI